MFRCDALMYCLRENSVVLVLMRNYLTLIIQEMSLPDSARTPLHQVTHAQLCCQIFNDVVNKCCGIPGLPGLDPSLCFWFSFFSIGYIYVACLRWKMGRIRSTWRADGRKWEGLAG